MHSEPEMREQLYNAISGNDDSARSVWYGRVMTILIIASLVPLCFHEEAMLFSVVEYVCVAVFIVDYAARWATADYKLGRGALSFVLYPFTPMAIIDLVTIVPTFIALNPAWRALRVLRLFRAMRAFRVIRYSKSANAIGRVFVAQKGMLLTVLAIAAFYVLISALVMFNAEPDTFPTFFDAAYWAVVSLTTVGYGDLYPTSEVGRFVAMLSSFAGIAVIALPSGIITAGLIDELKGDSDEDEVQEIETS